MALYGYVSGERRPVRFLLDGDTSNVAVGDFIMAGTTAGYVKQAGANDVIIGVAMEKVDSPTSDGGASLLVDISTLSMYRYPPDAGTVTQALVTKSMDVGGAQSVNIDASTDQALNCVGVDTDDNVVFVTINPVFAAV